MSVPPTMVRRYSSLKGHRSRGHSCYILVAAIVCLQLLLFKIILALYCSSANTPSAVLPPHLAVVFPVHNSVSLDAVLKRLASSEYDPCSGKLPQGVKIPTLHDS